MKQAETEPCTAVATPAEVQEKRVPGLLEELCTDIDEKGQVTVHCVVKAEMGDAIRIWPTTFLVCRLTGHRSKLLHAEGIPHAPDWRTIPPGGMASFTLIFAALPNDCVLFDLVEDIPDEGGFYSPAILRNGMDVYRVEV